MKYMKGYNLVSSKSIAAGPGVTRAEAIAKEIAPLRSTENLIEKVHKQDPFVWSLFQRQAKKDAKLRAWNDELSFRRARLTHKIDRDHGII